MYSTVANVDPAHQSHQVPIVDCVQVLCTLSAENEPIVCILPLSLSLVSRSIYLPYLPYLTHFLDTFLKPPRLGQPRLKGLLRRVGLKTRSFRARAGLTRKLNCAGMIRYYFRYL